MKNHLGFVELENGFHPKAIFHAGHHIHCPIGSGLKFFTVVDFKLKLVKGRLSLINQDDPRGIVLQQLAYHLAADRTGSSGYHHHLIVDVVGYVLVIEANGIAFEQLFNAYFTQLP